ncbi:MAG: indole-3-glycerol phosphate synthase TrpC [Erysipelotrichaceae bacterium]|nr:indole-3-glycerol phosphate synthase TrpC [Erysipelotrichaceae bacterium]MDD3810041.1 indole-3-glycerol phosphate synthase TrpC [Erysipelotrichaceae bacterium]
MILDKLVEATKKRVANQKKEVPIEELKSKCKEMAPAGDFPFEQALNKPGLNYILEVKKASPSKGLIMPEFDYLNIARDYLKIGASCLSVLTEPDYFQGSDEYLEAIAAGVDLPILRKDFIIDEYMIYQARLLNADAILLICRILDQDTLERFYGIAQSLGLSCLFEIHDQDDLDKALKAKARIIGVNNRNLDDFTIDLNNSLKYQKKAHEAGYQGIFISESGIFDRQDIAVLEQNDFNGVLIGESIVKAADRQEYFDMLRGTNDKG